MAGKCALDYQSVRKIPGPPAAGGAAAIGGNPATPGAMTMLLVEPLPVIVPMYS